MLAVHFLQFCLRPALERNDKGKWKRFKCLQKDERADFITIKILMQLLTLYLNVCFLSAANFTHLPPTVYKLCIFIAVKSNDKVKNKGKVVPVLN